jgi:hypothetical protein
MAANDSNSCYACVLILGGGSNKPINKRSATDLALVAYQWQDSQNGLFSFTSLTAANLLFMFTAVLGNGRFLYWTTLIALNRASANQTLTGILSIVFAWIYWCTVTLISCWGDYTLHALGLDYFRRYWYCMEQTQCFQVQLQILRITTNPTAWVKVSAGAVTGALFGGTKRWFRLNGVITTYLC